MGGASGGLSLYIDKGHLAYEYNMMIIERYSVKSATPLAAGKHKIEVDMTIARPGAPGTVVMKVDGAQIGNVELKHGVPLAFTATETFDVGTDLGAPGSWAGTAGAAEIWIMRMVALCSYAFPG